MEILKPKTFEPGQQKEMLESAMKAAMAKCNGRALAFAMVVYWDDRNTTTGMAADFPNHGTAAQAAVHSLVLEGGECIEEFAAESLGIKKADLEKTVAEFEKWQSQTKGT